MRTTLLALLAIASPVAAQEADIAPPGCDYGSPHPDAPEELAQFDFLIGDYAITAHAWRNGAWTPPRPGPAPRWNGRYILGGMAIADEWYDPDPGLDPDGGRGVNIRMWDPEDGEWDMMWIATGGRQVQDLRAGMVDGKLTMRQVYPERANFRATFERLGPDSWQRITYAKDEAGEWQPTFKLVATRIPCPA
ncbi:hypothetical protein [Alteriqipengyuania sp.]|uniref:hypothetical protein n=1 Tax=Alteriqipengyuania sp. TaxID=2800692 RepID=UPI003518B414